MTERPSGYTCPGCYQPIMGEPGTLWINHPLGMTTLRVHRDQGCARAALDASEGTLMPGNRPPLSREERAALAQKEKPDGGSEHRP